MRKIILGLALIGALFAASVGVARTVRADYTGPNRKARGWYHNVLIRSNNAYVCTFVYTCGDGIGNIPGVRCSSGVCQSLAAGSTYYKVVRVGGHQDPPATVNAGFQCGVMGNNGWCRSGGVLHVTANEPVSGKVITAIETSQWGYLCQPHTANPTCNYALPDGQGTVSVWAESSYGDSSTQVSVAWKVDTTAPALNASVPSPDGQNGWYVSAPVQISATGSDATSGLASVQCRVDGGTWQSPPVNVTGDGSHTVECQAEDNAGNAATWVRTVKIDTTAPVLNPLTSSPDGHNGWHVSAVTVQADASDAVSGVAKIEYQVDGGAWQNGSAVTITSDGVHTVRFRATDVAGNTTTSNPVTVKVDTTPPVSAFQSPAEGATVWGVVSLQGQSDDPTSGPAMVEVSTDGGTTWKPATLVSSTAQWTALWDTRPLPDGRYTLMARAVDNAGNHEHTAIVHVTVANAPPQIRLAPQTWYFWQTARAEITPSPYIPLKAVTVKVLGPPGYVREWDYGAVQRVPIHWNTRWYSETGPWAHPGTYRVVVEAVDIYGHRSQVEGQVIVPEPAPTATPTPTVTPTATATPTPTATPTAKPTATPALLPTATVTPAVSPTPTPHQAVGAVQASSSNHSAVLWLLAAAGVLGVAVSFDPRPREIRALTKSLAHLLEDDHD